MYLGERKIEITPAYLCKPYQISDLIVNAFYLDILFPFFNSFIYALFWIYRPLKRTASKFLFELGYLIYGKTSRYAYFYRKRREELLIFEVNMNR